MQIILRSFSKGAFLMRLEQPDGYILAEHCHYEKSMHNNHWCSKQLTLHAAKNANPTAVESVFHCFIP
jgi:hypothetical protein